MTAQTKPVRYLRSQHRRVLVDIRRRRRQTTCAGCLRQRASRPTCLSSPREVGAHRRKTHPTNVNSVPNWWMATAHHVVEEVRLRLHLPLDVVAQRAQRRDLARERLQRVFILA